MKSLITKLTIAVLLLVLVPNTAKSQHKPQYTQYLLNNYLINPSIAGIEGYADFKLGYRTQWSQIKGAPETYYLTGHVPIYPKRNKNKRPMPKKLKNKYEISNERMNNVYSLESIWSHHGLGIMLSADNIGSFRRYSGEFTYAYHQRLFRGLFASVGFSAGYILDRLETSDIDMGDPDDIIFNNSGALNKHNYDLTTGILIYGNHFYLGLSACQLFKEESHFLNTSDEFKPTNNYNYFGTFALRLRPSEYISFVPSVIVKYLDMSPLSFDLSLKAMAMSRFWAGIAYRNSQTFSFFAGMCILPYLELTYSYDYGGNQLDISGHGSSELMLGFKLGSKQKTHCPIYF